MNIQQAEMAVLDAERAQRAAESFLADLKKKRQTSVDEEARLNAPAFIDLSIPDRARKLMELASDITCYDIQLRLAEQATEQAAVKVVEARQQLTFARNQLVGVRNRIRSAEELLAQLQVRNVRGEDPSVKVRLMAEANSKLADLRTQLATLTTQPTQSELPSAA